ncbi:hypothetical protein COO91_04390 [Nostoc flagelliforme CCNUN1]|uniref:Uncharacterized protein n=1 Tax=Nostoc flagelliforme CCNUN1 TaxID=2038116 RepID=A0A2K8SSU1_9NOSO|nr:hypothetical protein COO91_04390 [Nostoc flagelliforme CCNUN1]
MPIVKDNTEKIKNKSLADLRNFSFASITSTLWYLGNTQW